ncbi:hypothetical protein WR25_10546 [Diploscapter pachys]|uniref:Metalloendopeptidase n=1 Tax=Diploscapter pachys TaxID=2018661 RepID=A0A2A2LUX7_9BILA|nr:hypothetical protein WR25_10546 [Diploscapter pachys]
MFTIDKCGCCSYVGRRGDGPQAISIGKNCDKFGIVVHELGHVVGFWHEHTRPDREFFVDIFYKNIQPGQDYNFEKSKPDEVDSLGESYDFASIMHYARDTFSRGNFHDTILPKPNSGFRSEIGQRVQLSEGDIRQTKKLYKCGDCSSTSMSESAILLPSRAGKCIWRIIAAEGQTVFLNVTGGFLLPMSKDDCKNEERNYINIRDGYSPKSRVIEKICGGNIDYKTVVSSGSRMIVELRSQKLIPEPFAVYHSICGGPIYGDSGTLQSPGYPDSYPPNTDCLWTIHVSKGYKVALEIVYFYVEQHKDCVYDKVVIWEGSNNTHPLDTLCGSIEHKQIQTKSSNVMAIRFFSDNSVQKAGFELHFVKELDECSSEDNYCEQICINTIGGYKCACEVGQSLREDGKTCESTCGGVLHGQSGSFASPNYPNLYPPSKNCIWQIEAEPGFQIFLNFTKFHIEGMKAECAYDYVRIDDHEKLCGEFNENLLFTSQTNKVRVEFASDASIEKAGFSVNFIADLDECQHENAGCEHICQNRLGSYICQCHAGYVLSDDGHNCKEGGCSFELNSPSGEIQTPNFPHEYPKMQNCTWLFITTPGHRPSQISKLKNILNVNTITLAYMMDRQEIRRYVLWFLYTTPNIIIYESDASGFRLRFFSISKGVFRSLLIRYTDCWWRISSARPNNGIHLHFTTFRLEEDDNCQYDYVEIYEGFEAKKEREIGRYCGHNIPDDITVRGSHDSGSSKTLDSSLPVANDEGKWIQRLGKLPTIRRGIKRWAVTQRMSIKEQLESGIRYLDIRVSRPPFDKQSTSETLENIRICHALYGLHYREVLLEVREFLNEHSKEILILDINHAYGFQKEDLKCFREITIETLRHADICPVTQPTDVSLEYMWRNNYRVIVFTPFCDSTGLFWPQFCISNIWPNTNNLDHLLDFLNEKISRGPLDIFNVLQCVLTARMKDIILHWCSSLEKTLCSKINEMIYVWLNCLSEKDKQTINIIFIDFVDTNFTRRIVGLNFPGSNEESCDE